MLYNIEQKKRYFEYLLRGKERESIEDRKKKEEYVRAFKNFQAVAALEERIGKDVSNWTKEEAVVLFSSDAKWAALPKKAWVPIISVFRDYASWCDFGRETYNDIEKDLAGFIKSVKNRNRTPQAKTKLFSPAELKRLKSMFNNMRDAYVIYARWLSLSLEEILIAKIEDIDEEAGMMKLYRRSSDERVFQREIKVPKDFIDICKEANEEMMINADDIYTRTKVYGDEIYKRRKKIPVLELTDQNFKHAIDRVRGIANGALNKEGYKLEWISKSAVIYHIRILAAEEGISLKDAIETEEGIRIFERYGFNGERAQKNFFNYYKEYLE